MSAKELYNAKTAFGNTALITEISKEQAEMDRKQAIKKCQRCDDWGEVNEECDQCDGRGSITVACSHDE